MTAKDMAVQDIDVIKGAESATQEPDPIARTPFGADGARFLCNLLQHGVFLGGVMLLLMIIGYFCPPA
ncbi:MAG: hypothetical protein WDZ49_08435 [Litorilinea sp.]